jgi:YebC/PmpR family DNA-binding regulatory protein
VAGHSQFKNIMHRKGAQDARRARQFARVIREITVAARQGLPDPAANPRLRAAITAARQVNMPRDTVDRAIRKATGESGGEDYVEVRYEGYGPHGVAVIVEALTDNRNRTASDVRAAFSKHGGALGETNSVSFLFSRLGVIRYRPEAGSADAVLEAAIEAGADNAETTASGHEITCPIEDFFAVRDALEARLGAPEEARIEWRPGTWVTLDAERGAAVLKLLDALDDNDDVQNVSANLDLPEDVLARLSAA